MHKYLAFLCLPLAIGTWFAIAYSGTFASPIETGAAAINLLHNGVIGNPFWIYMGVVTGPTAHVSPVTTTILAAIYAMLGENSVAARVALSLLSVASYCAATAASLWIVRAAGGGRFALRAVVLLTCLLPIWLFPAAIYIRTSDQWIGVLVLAAAMVVHLRAEAGALRRYRAEALLGLLLGSGLLIVPSVGLAVIVSLAMVIWKRRQLQPWWRGAILAGTLAACLAVPWGVRNYFTFGSFILTRSNFGLEFAAGNQPGVEGFYDPGVMGGPIHPSTSLDAARRMRQVGEIAYYGELKEAALRRIEANPWRFARVTAQRVWLNFFPTTDMIGFVPGPWRVEFALFNLFGVLKALAMAMLLVNGPRRAFWLAYCLLPSAPYFITHINLRYEYLTFFSWTCLVAIMAERSAAPLMNRVGGLRGRELG